VISYNLWTKVFGRDKNVLGAIYTLDPTRMTLVGVVPPRFQIGEVDLWLLFAYLGLKAMIAFIPANTIPLQAVVTRSPVALLFSLSATIFTTLVCELAPALHALRSDCVCGCP
jgi:hypothetical protein